MTKNWFEVDRAGLSRLIEKQGKAFIIFELLQNGWDEDSTHVNVVLKKIPGRPLAELIVEDDSPEGFSDLSHAYTLFADSKKKGNAELRGRFNLGEKLVLALCESATITTTTGTVKFGPEGRVHSKEKTQAGSKLHMLIRMNQQEYNEVCAAVKTVIPPKPTTFNGETLSKRAALKLSAPVKLATIIADDEGMLRNTIRTTHVEIYNPLPGRPAYVYEMGIPVVESGFKYDVNVLQRVPLNMQRDNITPAYRRELGKIVLNEMYDFLKPEDADTEWVSEAAGVEGIKEEAVKKVAKLQFGDKFVALDPTDKESAEKAQTNGYTVIGSRGISKGFRERLKEFGALKTSSQLFPTPKPFSDDPTAPMAEYIPESDWTSGMKLVSDYIKNVSCLLIRKEVSVEFVKQMGTTACFDRTNLTMTFNMSSLGKKFFDNGASQEVNRLMLHELAHYYSGSHHHEDYYKALEKLGAQLTEIALTENLIQKYRD